MNGHENNFIKKSPLLGDLINQVQEELIESQRRRQQERRTALFEVDSLTIEAHFVIAESAKAKGGFSLKVLTLGGETDYSKQRVHKITLTLKTVSDENQELGIEDIEREPNGRRPRR